MGIHNVLAKLNIDHEITGVDIKLQKHYPFNFIQADALTFPLDGYDFYWASPPCQGYSIMRNLPWNKNRNYPLLIDTTRQRLLSLKKPYIIENVMGAKMPAGWLCGTMFGKPYYRHRAFDTSYFWLQPSHARHTNIINSGRYLKDRARKVIFKNPNSDANTAEIRQAFDIDWMNQDELSQAIPPVYREYLMNAFLRNLKSE